jgi:cytochrome c oxidase subunit 5a
MPCPFNGLILSACKAALRSAANGCFPYVAVKSKVENDGQYQQYLEELKPLREELGVLLQEEMYPQEKK